MLRTFTILILFSINAVGSELPDCAGVNESEIARLIQRYSLIVSSGDSSRYLELKSLYARGGVFDGLEKFNIDDEFEKYIGYLESLQRDGGLPNLRQFLGASVVTVTGETATAITPVLLLSTTVPRQTRIVAAGELHDRLLRVNRTWKFSYRKAVVDGSTDG